MLSSSHVWPFPPEVIAMAEDVYLSLSGFHQLGGSRYPASPRTRVEPYRARRESTTRARDKLVEVGYGWVITYHKNYEYY